MKILHKHYEEIVTETSTEIEMTNRYYLWWYHWLTCFNVAINL
jgi:hypothetical protein